MTAAQRLEAVERLLVKALQNIPCVCTTGRVSEQSLYEWRAGLLESVRVLVHMPDEYLERNKQSFV